MQILGRGDRRHTTIGRYIDTGQANFFFAAHNLLQTTGRSTFLRLICRGAKAARARSMRRPQRLR
jgi:hypothetical protein